MSFQEFHRCPITGPYTLTCLSDYLCLFMCTNSPRKPVFSVYCTKHSQKLPARVVCKNQNELFIQKPFDSIHRWAQFFSYKSFLNEFPCYQLFACRVSLIKPTIFDGIRREEIPLTYTTWNTFPVENCDKWWKICECSQQWQIESSIIHHAVKITDNNCATQKIVIISVLQY